jgi:hypothetical protein
MAASAIFSKKERDNFQLKKDRDRERAKDSEPLTIGELEAAVCVNPTPLIDPDGTDSTGLALVLPSDTSKVNPCPGLIGIRSSSRYLDTGMTCEWSSLAVVTCGGCAGGGSWNNQATESSFPKNWNSCKPDCSAAVSGNIGIVRFRSVRCRHML